MCTACFCSALFDPFLARKDKYSDNVGEIDAEPLCRLSQLSQQQSNKYGLRMYVFHGYSPLQHNLSSKQRTNKATVRRTIN